MVSGKNQPPRTRAPPGRFLVTMAVDAECVQNRLDIPWKIEHGRHSTDWRRPAGRTLEGGQFGAREAGRLGPWLVTPGAAQNFARLNRGEALHPFHGEIVCV